jgi:hypothetical protein
VDIRQQVSLLAIMHFANTTPGGRTYSTSVHGSVPKPRIGPDVSWSMHRFFFNPAVFMLGGVDAVSDGAR